MNHLQYLITYAIVLFFMGWGFYSLNAGDYRNAVMGIVAGLGISATGFVIVFQARNRQQRELRSLTTTLGFATSKAAENQILENNLGAALGEIVKIEQAWTKNMQGINLAWLVYWITGERLQKDIALFATGLSASNVLATKNEEQLRALSGLPTHFQLHQGEGWILISPGVKTSLASDLFAATSAATRMIASI